MFSVLKWTFSVLGLWATQCVAAKSVFAHFMVANTQNYTLEDWHSDISLAKASSIDAFVLNAGYGQRENNPSFRNAFAVAKELDFKLLFSLDHSGSKWPKDKVVDLLRNYSSHEAHFRHENGQALVTTFEGFEAANDWGDIKREIQKDRSIGKDKCCFFMPDWSSVGPRKANEPDAVDGLVSWDAWPYGDQVMNTTRDKEYMDILGSKPYVMPVSPWFYTNLKQFHKNWVWRGDDLWYSRWQEVIDLQPEYVEIITWNDYGESHYIGPVREDATGVVVSGAPFNYADGMPHDGWRSLLPYVIAQYKADPKEREKVAIPDELLTVWFRLSPANACGDGKTTGNSAGSHQRVMQPGDVLEDKVFFSALLESPSDVHVAIGGQNRTAEWSDTPKGGKGVYHGSIPFDRRTGEVIVTLSRGGSLLAEMKGEDISNSCPHDLTNWNAWVGNATAVKGGGAGGGGGGGDGDDETGGAVVVSVKMSMFLFGLASLFLV